jgi:hypothetical protein
MLRDQAAVRAPQRGRQERQRASVYSARASVVIHKRGPRCDGTGRVPAGRRGRSICAAITAWTTDDIENRVG